MLTLIKDTEVLKRYARSSSDPPNNPSNKRGGTVSAFPYVPLDLPTETFKKSMDKRDKNRKILIQWIQKNLKPEIDYGRIHIIEQCPYAMAGTPNLCPDISHWSMPMLYKAGAERIICALGLHADFPNIRDYELACIHKQEITTVVLSCNLLTSNNTVVATGTGARHIKQYNWNLNTTIKMAVKSALCDAVIRVGGLAGIFAKTHRHTLTKLGYCKRDNIPGIGVWNKHNFTRMSVCYSTPEKPITQKQKHLIQTIAGRKGFTTESLGNKVYSLTRIFAPNFAIASNILLLQSWLSVQRRAGDYSILASKIL